MSVRIAKSDEEIARCFRVMQFLRPHLFEEGFVERVRSMEREGFLLAFLEDSGEVAAVAGYRMHDLLFSGRTLYVDDLVTDPKHRSKGFGKRLLAFLHDQAVENRCSTLTLDSGVQRFDAHRFYFREGMSILGYHFSRPVGT